MGDHTVIVHEALVQSQGQNIKIKYDKEGKKKERKEEGGRKRYNPLILKIISLQLNRDGLVL